MMIKNLVRTCLACPSQWMAETEEGRAVYIRFRWGHLTVGIGNDIDEAVSAKPIFARQVSDDMDGFMTEEEMLKQTGISLS